jgi:protein-L-isoaspartate O-methyltransferase
MRTVKCLAGRAGIPLSTRFYNTNAAQLAQQYLANTFEQVHQAWLHLIPDLLNRQNSRVLDIGAGAGRDAKYLASLGHVNSNLVTSIPFTAVEPAKLLADFGRKQTRAALAQYLLQEMQVNFKFLDANAEAQQLVLANKNVIKKGLFNA